MDGFSYVVGLILGCLSAVFVMVMAFTILGTEWHCTKQQAIEGTVLDALSIYSTVSIMDYLEVT